MEQRRLARPRRADDRHQLARLDRQVDAAEHLDPADAVLVGLGEAAGADGDAHRSHRLRPDRAPPPAARRRARRRGRAPRVSSSTSARSLRLHQERHVVEEVDPPGHRQQPVVVEHPGAAHARARRPPARRAPATRPPSSTKAWRSAAGVAPRVPSMPISGRLLEMISARSATSASDATRTISDTATNITSFSRRRAKRSGRLRSCQVRTTLPGGSDGPAAGRRPRGRRRARPPRRPAGGPVPPSSVSATARGRAIALLLLLGARRLVRCRRAARCARRGCGPPRGVSVGPRRDDVERRRRPSSPQRAASAAGDVEPLRPAGGAGERGAAPGRRTPPARPAAPCRGRPASRSPRTCDLRPSARRARERRAPRRRGVRGVGARRQLDLDLRRAAEQSRRAARSGSPRSPPATAPSPSPPAPGRPPPPPRGSSRRRPGGCCAGSAARSRTPGTGPACAASEAGGAAQALSRSSAGRQLRLRRRHSPPRAAAAGTGSRRGSTAGRSSSMVRRSMPIASPPAGGMPCSRART